MFRQGNLGPTYFATGRRFIFGHVDTSQRVLVTTHIRDRFADTICAQLAVRTHQDGLWTAVQLFAY